MQSNRNWIWFFVVVGALAVLAMVSMIVYNLGRQLKPEQLAAARRSWHERGWRSYQLTYTVRRGIEQETDTYVVRVRDGKVISSTVNGRAEPPERFAYRDMDAKFDEIARFQEIDAKPGQPRTFCVGNFDPDNGALRQYVRRVMGSKERVEIVVDSLEPLDRSSD
jgi:hypothetical protein